MPETPGRRRVTIGGRRGQQQPVQRGKSQRRPGDGRDVEVHADGAAGRSRRPCRPRGRLRAECCLRGPPPAPPGRTREEGRRARRRVGRDPDLPTHLPGRRVGRRRRLGPLGPEEGDLHNVGLEQVGEDGPHLQRPAGGARHLHGEVHRGVVGFRGHPRIVRVAVQARIVVGAHRDDDAPPHERRWRRRAPRGSRHGWWTRSRRGQRCPPRLSGGGDASHDRRRQGEVPRKPASGRRGGGRPGGERQLQRWSLRVDACVVEVVSRAAEPGALVDWCLGGGSVGRSCAGSDAGCEAELMRRVYRAAWSPRRRTTSGASRAGLDRVRFSAVA